MAARVVHFGWDRCYRVPLLRSAGYDVAEPLSLEELAACFQCGKEVDALVISDDCGKSTAKNAVELFRRFSAAPVFLFRRSGNEAIEGTYEIPLPCLTPPDIWLTSLATLIAKRRSGVRPVGRAVAPSNDLDVSIPGPNPLPGNRG
jgi:hypothetical protein